MENVRISFRIWHNFFVSIHTEEEKEFIEVHAAITETKITYFSFFNQKYTKIT